MASSGKGIAEEGLADLVLSPQKTSELAENSAIQILLRSAERRNSAVLLTAEIAAVAAPFLGIGSTMVALSQGVESAELAFILGIASPLGVAGGAILESFRLARKARRLRDQLGLSAPGAELRISAEGQI